MAFASTGVASGAGVGVVAATGMDTAMGRIAHMLEHEQSPQTPLQQRLKRMGKVMGVGVVLICAVIFLFFHKLNPFSPQKTALEKRKTWDLWGHVVVAVIPAGVLGVLLDDWLDAHLYNYITVAITLILYGVAFLFLERNRRSQPSIRRTSEISWSVAVYIGLFQCLSMIPGTSRSGATILGAMLLGLSRSAAAEFSFFLAIPTMVGASFLKILKFVKEGVGMTGQEAAILIVGCLVAFVVSLIAIRSLMNYVKRHSFAAFGVYRIALGLVVLLYFLFARAGA